MSPGEGSVLRSPQATAHPNPQAPAKQLGAGQLPVLPATSSRTFAAHGRATQPALPVSTLRGHVQCCWWHPVAAPGTAEYPEGGSARHRLLPSAYSRIISFPPPPRGHTKASCFSTDTDKDIYSTHSFQRDLKKGGFTVISPFGSRGTRRGQTTRKQLPGISCLPYSSCPNRALPQPSQPCGCFLVQGRT